MAKEIKSPKGYIPLQEALEQVMLHKNCTLEEARKLLTQNIKDKKVHMRRVKVPVEQRVRDVLDPAEALKRDPKEVCVTLANLMRLYHFSVDEMHDELRSGRLIVSMPSIMHENMKMDEALGKPLASIPPELLEITVAALRNWITDPNTPQALIHKVIANAK
jgi:hypothetical protein